MDSQVLHQAKSSVLVAVLKDTQSILLVAQPNGTTLTLTTLGPIGSTGADTVSLIRNRERVAILSSSSKTCLDGGPDCNIPGLEVIVENQLTTCLSSELGVSIAATGWAYGGIFYVVHAIRDDLNPRKSNLRVFRIDERVDPTHCRIEAVHSVQMTQSICGTYEIGSEMK